MKLLELAQLIILQLCNYFFIFQSWGDFYDDELYPHLSV